MLRDRRQDCPACKNSARWGAAPSTATIGPPLPPAAAFSCGHTVTSLAGF